MAKVVKPNVLPADGFTGRAPGFVDRQDRTITPRLVFDRQWAGVGNELPGIPAASLPLTVIDICDVARVTHTQVVTSDKYSPRLGLAREDLARLDTSDAAMCAFSIDAGTVRC